ncbi:uncharacterized protein LOC127729524 [Mytilus californianus]|uniref:uncharacterized protein LOC127729524 n=1 Tax=Mytilus californianus TaxID=6549 RepID=UPI0022484E6A|nr:uncharacterized protein LOC127729524 [Mytilus californianus]
MSIEDKLPTCDRQHCFDDSCIDQAVGQVKDEKQTQVNNKAFDDSCIDQAVGQVKEEKQTQVNNKVKEVCKEVKEEESVGNGRDNKHYKEVCVVVVGDGACGKTSLIEVFKTGEFKKNHIPTCFQTYNSSITVQGIEVQLKVRDTPGQENFADMRSKAYHDADVFIVCFAVDNQDSFSNVNSVWNKELKTNYPEVPRILVGNKIDIRENKKKIEKLQKEKKNIINDETASDVKDILGMNDYVSCSAKINTGVADVFKAAATAAI